jgi:putative phosphonate metabolism protein
MMPRYAVYFSPAITSPWWAFGAGWLGRDECRNQPLEQAELEEISREAFYAMTQAPRRYGFHATLKAPFHLKSNFGKSDLIEKLVHLSKQLKPVELGALCAVKMGDFVALVPQKMSTQLSYLAEKCVTEIDDMRAPLTAIEIARRNVDSADVRGQFLLEKFGYPHVMERFIFHFTLSGRVTPQVADSLLKTVVSPLKQMNRNSPLVLDRLCLFVEDAPGEPFRRIADMALTG